MNSLKLKDLDLKDLSKIGHNIGQELKGGEVFELVSDLGGGKTTLTKAIVKGTKSDDQVSSPSFTICNEYSSKNFKIYHFDFYRLLDPGIISLELKEILEDSQNSIVIIEWPESVLEVLPKNHIKIVISISGDGLRDIVIYYPDDLAYLLRGVSK